MHNAFNEATTVVDNDTAVRYNVDEETRHLLQQQLILPKKTYVRVKAVAERNNRAELAANGVLPKLDSLTDGKTRYTYMNFDEQDYDVNLIFVDKARIGTRKETIMQEEITNAITGRRPGQTSYGRVAQAWYASRGESRGDSDVRGIGGEMSTAQSAYRIESNSGSQSDSSRGTSTRDEHSSDRGRGTGESDRGRVNTSTDDGAFFDGQKVNFSENAPTTRQSRLSTAWELFDDGYNPTEYYADNPKEFDIKTSNLLCGLMMRNGEQAGGALSDNEMQRVTDIFSRGKKRFALGLSISYPVRVFEDVTGWGGNTAEERAQNVRDGNYLKNT